MLPASVVYNHEIFSEECQRRDFPSGRELQRGLGTDDPASPVPNPVLCAGAQRSTALGGRRAVRNRAIGPSSADAVQMQDTASALVRELNVLPIWKHRMNAKTLVFTPTAWLLGAKEERIRTQDAKINAVSQQYLRLHFARGAKAHVSPRTKSSKAPSTPKGRQSE